jgi:ATP-dependent Lon protease
MNMDSLDYNAISRLERELVFILKEEYSFYQSLYITMDKQRDSIKFNRDEHLLDLFAEIERCHRRIRIKKLVNSLATMVKKNMTLVSESEEYLRERYERIREELGELKNSHKILQYVSDGDPSPQFVDGKN